TVSVAAAAASADGGISSGVYFAALLGRFGTVVLLCALVIRDIVRPESDVVRAEPGAVPGRDAGESAVSQAGGRRPGSRPAVAAPGDDPAGGVLAGAPDHWVLRLRSSRATPRDVGT
ncbi:MAG TPA: hypothetical protein VIV12_02740, partial [Streptosporangiaceae bacterium]